MGASYSHNFCFIIKGLSNTDISYFLLTMTKTKIQALEEIHDKTLTVIIDSEIQIEYLKKQDPKRIVFPNREVVVAGIRMKKDFTAEMLVKMEETKLGENSEVLKIIEKKIKEEEKGFPSTATPQGPVS